MSSQVIDLVTTADLRTHNGSPREFFIPSYQRGYRWTRTQVTQLLEDIREFERRTNPQPQDFYCLQPLVIKQRPDGKLEVVDGQQRLTTLFLILRHFNERLAARFQAPTFKLTYETRTGLDSFLVDPSEQLASENADYFHFFHAISAIETWFAAHDEHVETLKTHLLTRTKVIWYQLNDGDNPIDAFARLNVGKIPLTNDELIRALFLRRKGDSSSQVTERQLRIAQEWDQLEKALQSNAFWYFLNNTPGPKSSRIGLLFELVASEDTNGALEAADAYSLFYHFNSKLSSADADADLSHEWAPIKRVFLTLEEWFDDRVLFHLIGFLVADGMSIRQIRTLSSGCAKSAFEKRLRDEIFRRTIRKNIAHQSEAESISVMVGSRLSKLTYASPRNDIRQILLLFNLATLLSDSRSNIRFQFESYKGQAWDIEHIRSVSDDRPDRHDERKTWLVHCHSYLEADAQGELLRADIGEFLGLPRNEASNDVFDPLYDRVLALFGESGDSDAEHGLGNLTLLDKSTNRSYGNSVFAIKRKSILKLDRAGIFVPLCTRNVFLKCYSGEVGHALRWTRADQDGYLEAIAKELTAFFAALPENQP